MVYGLLERLLWLGYVKDDYNGLVDMPQEDFDTDYRDVWGSGTLGRPRPLYWVIKDGKQKNEPDLTDVNVQRVTPLPAAGSAGLETFRGGLFIIHARDVVDVDGKSVIDYINHFNANTWHDPDSNKFDNKKDYDLGSNPTRQIAAYELKTKLLSSQVAVRYIQTQRPFIGVMDSTDNNDLQVEVLNHALWHPDHRVILSASRVQQASATSCWTVLTEPHFKIKDWDDAVDYTLPIQNFVASGGNFNAQCHGVESYEDLIPLDPTKPISATNPVAGSDDKYYKGGPGLFMSTRGISKEDTSNEEAYFNSDLAIAQFHGPAQRDQGGSLQTMVVDTTPNEDPKGINVIQSDGQNSEWEWFSYGVIEQVNPDISVAGDTSRTVTNDRGRWWRSRGAKYARDKASLDEAGHNVFYLGGHEYTGLNAPLDRTNSQRVFLNAMIIPATRPADCKLSICLSLACDSRDCFGNCINGQGCVTSSDCAGFCGAFTSRFIIRGALGSLTLNTTGASVHGDMYYNWANNSIAMEFYAPDQNGWTGGITRTDVLRSCKLARHVLSSCGPVAPVCTTLVDQRPMYRFFREPLDTTLNPYTNPTSDSNFPTACPMQLKKGAASTFADAVDVLWGRSEGSRWVVCAARLKDGTLYEFYANDGVTWGASLHQTAEPMKEITMPAVDYDFDKDKTWNCPDAKCDENTELVFVIDEQNSIPNSDADWGEYLNFAVSAIDSFTVRGDTKFGGFFPGNGNPNPTPVSSPDPLINQPVSFSNAMDGKKKQKAGGETDWLGAHLSC